MGRFVLVGEISDIGVPGRRATAVRVENGLIAQVGGDDVVAQAQRDGVVVVDLGHRYVAPGFVDAHAHLEVAVRAQTEMLDCRVPTVGSVADLLDHLSAHRDQARDGWLVGQGNLFYDQKLADGRLPTRQELDRVSGELAIAIRAGGHTTVLNSRALESFDVAAYESGEGMMGGAVVGRNADGQLNGVIGELDAVVPFPSPGPGEFKAALVEGTREIFASHGVTTVGDISESRAGLAAVQESAEAGELPVRVSTNLWVPGTFSFEEACQWRTQLAPTVRPDRFEVRGVKLFADGGFSSRNAAVRTPFLELDPLAPDALGKINLSVERLAEHIRQADDAGLQAVVHANGERAQDAVCEAARLAGPTSLPVRIEHAGNLVTTPETYERWREVGAVPVSQAVFLYNFGDSFVPLLGPEVGDARFPFRSMLENGFEPVGSSDVYLGAEPEQSRPLFSMWCAVERRTFRGEVANPTQALTVREALEMHTLAGARALGREDSIGSIEVGKKADLAVLGENPEFATSLRTLGVDLVLLEGEVVHLAPEARDLATRLRP